MTNERFEYLDSVRGIACMIVVFFHSLIFLYPQLTKGNIDTSTPQYLYLLNYPPFSLLIAGQSAVCLFFIHSGFVLSYKHIGNKNIGLNLIQATIKRPIRLLGVILLTLVPLFAFFLTKDFWVNRIWSDYDVYLNLFYRVLFNPFSISISENPPLWTITTELWGSFLVFSMCYILSFFKQNYRILILICSIILLIKTFYFSFLLGILLSDLHKNRTCEYFSKHKNMFSYIILLPAIICCSYQCYLSPCNQYWDNVDFIMGGYSMIGAMFIIVFVLCNIRIQKLLSFKPLIFIGGISYSIYVLHWIITKREILSYRQYYSNDFLAIITLFIVVIFYAYIVDRMIDKPCIKFSTWFASKIITLFNNKIHYFKAL